MWCSSCSTRAINGRSIFAGDPSQDELDAIQAELSVTVEESIKSQLNLFEAIFAAINPDNIIASKVFTFAIDKLLADGQTILNARLRLDDPEHDWELRGRVLASEPCPFTTLNRTLVANREAQIDLADFHTFRSRAVASRRLNMLSWMAPLSRNTTTITRALLASAETRQLAKTVTAGIRKMLDAPTQQMPDELLTQISRLLDAGIKVGSDTARRELTQLKNVTGQLRGKTADQIIEALDERPPRGTSVRTIAARRSAN